MTDARLARPLWRGRTNVDALTISCIERAEADERNPNRHEFIVTQGSYQGTGGDPDSAGTHALGGAVDLHWCGHDSCILALRQAGMAATWHRTPLYAANGSLIWPDHTHAVVYGHPYLAPVASRQVTAVLAGRNGLANNGADDGPRLDPFPQAVWPPEGDDMNAAQDERLKAIETKVDVIGAALAKFVKDEADRAAAEKQRDRASWKRDLKIIKEMVEHGADLDELVAYVDKHGQPDT